MIKEIENKVFIVNRSELQGRFDAQYYKNDFKNVLDKINSSKYKVVFFKDIIKSINNGYDFRDYKEIGTPYIKVANLKMGGFDFKRIQYIDFNSDSITKNIQLKQNNLLLTRKGTFGIAMSLNQNYDYVISSELFYIVLNQEKIISKFLEIYLNSELGQQQFLRVSIGAIMGSLSQEAVKKAKIILPNLNIQQKIINYYHSAYSLKQQKEAEAEELLNSIDGYLLSELGIKLPQKSYEINNRIFTVKFSEISGNRYDAFEFYNKSSKLEGGKFKNVKLLQLANLVKGQSITSSKIIEGVYPVIAGGKSSPYTHNEYNFECNVITVSASGAYSGYVWYHSNPIFASDCTVITSKNELALITKYLYYILKLKQNEIYNLQQGAGQPHVYARDLEKLEIPVPPFEKQKEIVEYLNNLHQKVEILKSEAKEILEKAKQEVENMIIGDLD